MPIKQTHNPNIWDFREYDPVVDRVMGLDVLYQDKEWLTKDGRRLRLEDMTPAHRGNLLRYLRRHARGLEFKDAIIASCGPMAPRGEAATDAFDMYLDFRRENPLDWLNDLPFIKRLEQLVEIDEAKFQERVANGEIDFTDV